MTSQDRLLLDLAMFVSFSVAFNPALTGLPVHEWLSVALVAPAALHLLLNWKWVERVMARLAAKMRAATRVNLALDSALFVATIATMVSGVMVSRSILGLVGISLASPAWIIVHSWSADATIVLLVAHFATHWQWTLGVVRRAVPGPRRALQWNSYVPPGVPGVRAMTSVTHAHVRSDDVGRTQATRGRSRPGLSITSSETLAVTTLSVAVAVAVFTGVAAVSPFLPAAAVATSRQAAGSASAVATQTCPRTGCVASGCHADHGQSAQQYYGSQGSGDSAPDQGGRTYEQAYPGYQ